MFCDTNTTRALRFLSRLLAYYMCLSINEKKTERNMNFDNDGEGLEFINRLLDISSSQVANLKKRLNQMLFGEGTSRTLYKNLSLRYKFYSL